MDASRQHREPSFLHAVSPTPSDVLDQVDGLELEVAGVVAWPEEIDVRLSCRPNARTREIADEYAGEIGAWRARREQGAQEEFPGNPAQMVLGRNRPGLADNVGTAYEWTSGGGWGWDGETGVHWWTAHTFRPSPPSNATWLDVTVEFVSGEPRTARFAL
jgi:hypothetical protein